MYQLPLLCATLLVSFSTGWAQVVPPQECIDTGSVCINDCTGLPTDSYQWCGGCDYFIQCEGDAIFYEACEPDTIYDDVAKACFNVSSTCKECVVPVALCEGTGSTCVPDCLAVPNGVYQWCGRCDYFVQCSANLSYYTECPADLEFDDSVKACVVESTTCLDEPCAVPIGNLPPFRQ